MLLAIVLAVVAFALGGAAVAVLLRREAEREPVVPPRPRIIYSPAASLSSLVVEALDQGVVVVDAEDRVVLLNPAARAMNIIDVDRLTFPDLVELADRARAQAQHLHRTVDLPIGRLGREPISLAVDAVPLVTEVEQAGAVGLLLSDMSEHRRLEAVRRDFVANVSHELKTPVGALTLLAEAVQDAADDPEGVARFAARMQHEGTRLARLVQELMELSRVQGAEPLPGDALVDVGRVLSEAVDRSRLLAEQANIGVLCRPEGELAVHGNETQLITAIGNLIDNAIAYSSPHTRVSVTSRAETDADGTAWVAVSVTDQGIGIADADLDRVFERFYRVDPARSRATGGTGLGLAIVKHIATNHGGTVAVWSGVDSGSTFTIRLPLAADPAPAATPIERIAESHV